VNGPFRLFRRGEPLSSGAGAPGFGSKHFSGTIPTVFFAVVDDKDNRENCGLQKSTLGKE
jgi:hypothetical protein